ncbi:hypothetical protein [Burkholderia multivorans]|uniref:hypothetical protein n=1 Tax=Burkholderia multivorans TaxID=87883 RepID=UPI0006A60999|nr:hypothetical protein [Burkholderia multivorans]KOE23740.1 hypothetical protein AI46_22470 [Burkholderia multivorans R-20526]
MKYIRAARRHLAFAGIAFGMLLSGAAHAQLDLQSIGSSLLGGGQQAAPAQGGVAQLLQAYVGANRQVLAGQSSLASAMGLSGAAGQAQQAAAVLGNGDALTPAALSQMGGAQQSVSQALDQAFASGGATQGAVDKQAFSNGLASLGQGLTQYSQLQPALGGLGSTNPASLLQVGLNPQNLQAASYIAQSAPGQLQSLATTLSQAVQFATSQGISVPSVASSALKLLP